MRFDIPDDALFNALENSPWRHAVAPVPDGWLSEVAGFREMTRVPGVTGRAIAVRRVFQFVRALGGSGLIDMYGAVRTCAVFYDPSRDAYRIQGDRQERTWAAGSSAAASEARQQAIDAYQADLSRRLSSFCTYEKKLRSVAAHLWRSHCNAQGTHSYGYPFDNVERLGAWLPGLSLSSRKSELLKTQYLQVARGKGDTTLSISLSRFAVPEAIRVAVEVSLRGNCLWAFLRKTGDGTDLNAICEGIRWQFEATGWSRPSSLLLPEGWSRVVLPSREIALESLTARGGQRRFVSQLPEPLATLALIGRAASVQRGSRNTLKTQAAAAQEARSDDGLIRISYQSTPAAEEALRMYYPELTITTSGESRIVAVQKSDVSGVKSLLRFIGQRAASGRGGVERFPSGATSIATASGKKRPGRSGSLGQAKVSSAGVASAA